MEIKAHSGHHFLAHARYLCDTLWTDMVSSGNNPLNGAKYNDRVGTVKALRESILAASEHVNELMSTNMEYMTHILSLRSELFQTRVDKEKTEKDINKRMESLLHVISTQQNRQDKMAIAMQLKGMWRKLIIPHCPEDDDGLSEGCAVALTWLSARCAQEVMESMDTIKYTTSLSYEANRMNGNDSRNIDGRNHVDLDLSHCSKSIVDKLIKKIQVLLSLVREDSESYEHKIRELTIKLSATQRDLNDNSYMYERAVQSLEEKSQLEDDKEETIRALSGKLDEATRTINNMQRTIEDIQKENARINVLYEASMAAREEWKRIFDGSSRPYFTAPKSVEYEPQPTHLENLSQIAEGTADKFQPDPDEANDSDQDIDRRSHSQPWNRLSRPLHVRRKYVPDPRPPFQPPSPHAVVRKSSPSSSRRVSPHSLGYPEAIEISPFRKNEDSSIENDNIVFADHFFESIGTYPSFKQTNLSENSTKGSVMSNDQRNKSRNSLDMYLCEPLNPQEFRSFQFDGK